MGLTDKQKSELDRRDMDQYKDLFERLSDDVRSNTRALHGKNGDAGLVGKVDTAIKDLSTISTDIKTLTTLIIGDVKNPDDTGFKGKMLNITTMLKQTKILFWSSIGTDSAAIIQFLFRWLSTAAEHINTIAPTGTPLP